MKVLLLNGSPNERGCTYTALSEVARTLEEEGIEAEIMHIKKNCIMGCTGCGACSGNGNRCIFDGGIVNEVLDKMETADGLIVGSPVYFASPTGAVLSLLDRIFMAGNKFYLKPAAAIASARRAGTTATIDVLNKYFNLAGMPIRPRKPDRMRKACRPCVPLEGTWHGCLNAWKRAGRKVL